MAAIHLAQKSKAKALETYRQAVRHPFLGTEHRSRVMRVFLHFLTYHLTRTEWTPFSGVPEYAQTALPTLTNPRRDVYAPSNPVEEALLLARLIEEANRKGYGWKDAELILPLVNHSVILYVAHMQCMHRIQHTPWAHNIAHCESYASRAR